MVEQGNIHHGRFIYDNQILLQGIGLIPIEKSSAAVMKLCFQCFVDGIRLHAAGKGKSFSCPAGRRHEAHLQFKLTGSSNNSLHQGGFSCTRAAGDNQYPRFQCLLHCFLLLFRQSQMVFSFKFFNSQLRGSQGTCVHHSPDAAGRFSFRLVKGREVKVSLFFPEHRRNVFAINGLFPCSRHDIFRHLQGERGIPENRSFRCTGMALHEGPGNHILYTMHHTVRIIGSYAPGKGYPVYFLKPKSRYVPHHAIRVMGQHLFRFIAVFLVDIRSKPFGNPQGLQKHDERLFFPDLLIGILYLLQRLFPDARHLS